MSQSFEHSYETAKLARMMRALLRRLLPPLGLLVAAAAPSAQSVGEPYPDLRLPTLEGETLSISSLRGKKLLLIEFASW